MHEDIRLFYLPDNTETTPFYLEMAGISYCDGSYKMHRKCSRETVLEYVVSGKGYLTVDGVDYEAAAGNIWLLRQNTTHSYYSDPNDPWTKIFFNIRGHLAEQIIEEYPIRDKVILNGTDFENDFREMLQILYDKYVPQSKLFDKTAIWFLQTVIQLSNNLVLPTRQNESIEMEKTKEYILLNLNRIISNEELANRIFRSKDYCIKKFQKTYGITPYEFQITQKLALAKNLLRSTYLPIGDISSRLGYDDQHHFSNLFKKHCGISPSEYRLKHH
mgnify:FL=1